MLRKKVTTTPRHGPVPQRSTHYWLFLHQGHLFKLEMREEETLRAGHLFNLCISGAFAASPGCKDWTQSEKASVSALTPRAGACPDGAIEEQASENATSYIAVGLLCSSGGRAWGCSPVLLQSAQAALQLPAGATLRDPRSFYSPRGEAPAALLRPVITTVRVVTGGKAGPRLTPQTRCVPLTH